MKGIEFNELAFFRAIHESGARALLIGRRALVVLGLPVLTADYDFWIAIDDIERFNTALARFDLQPSQSAEAARTRGRYALENDERIDVLVARSVPTVDGRTVVFDEVWLRRERAVLDQDVAIDMPSLDDLILTKRFAARPKPGGRSHARDSSRRQVAMNVPNVRDVIGAQRERRLTASEVEAYLSTPISDSERENVLSLIAWFRRRYPTPADRLEYVRRAYRRWTATP